MKVKGFQGPDIVDYARNRTVTRQLDADQVDELRSAFAEDGYDGARSWIDRNMQEYLEGWRIERLDDLDLD
jgi:transcription termination factor NusB